MTEDELSELIVNWFFTEDAKDAKTRGFGSNYVYAHKSDDVTLDGSFNLRKLANYLLEHLRHDGQP